MNLKDAMVAAGLSQGSAQESPAVTETAHMPDRELVSRETVIDGGDRILEYANSKGARWNQETGCIVKGHQVQVAGKTEFVNFVFRSGKPSLIGRRLTGTWKVEKLTFSDGKFYHEIVIDLRKPPSGAKLVQVTVGAKKEETEETVTLFSGGYLNVLPI